MKSEEAIKEDMKPQRSRRRRTVHLLAVVASLAFLVRLPAGAQTSELPVPLRSVGHPGLSRDAEWVLRVHESGGLSELAWTITLDSTGRVDCSGVEGDCREVSPRTIQEIAEVVSAVRPANWTGALGPCSDCSTKMVILTRRNAEARPIEHLTYWNLAVPEPALPALRLYDAVRQSLIPE
jgi:hypothetical protein